MNNIVRTKKQFLRAVKVAPKGSILIFDEAGIIPDNSKYINAINKEVEKAYNIDIDDYRSIEQITFEQIKLFSVNTHSSKDKHITQQCNSANKESHSYPCLRPILQDCGVDYV